MLCNISNEDVYDEDEINAEVNAQLVITFTI